MNRRKARRGFTLIELLVVIAIMGALVSLILPHLVSSEQEAKDTGCDYNNYGTLRYVTMFNSVNGAYPTGFHTGLNDGAATVVPGMCDPTQVNMVTGARSTIEDLTDDEIASLAAAGICHLADGSIGDDYGAPVADTTNVCKITAAASEAWDDDGDDFTINGKALADYAVADEYVVVALFVAPTMDWEHWYDADHMSPPGAGDSVVQIALPGKCPNLYGVAATHSGTQDVDFPYYICFFQVDCDDTDGTAPAKLIGTACPECGSLNP